MPRASHRTDVVTAVQCNNYWVLLPGLMVFGRGLALVLTVNDPTSLDAVPEDSQVKPPASPPPPSSSVVHWESLCST